ncbi:hypothetical protein Tco_1283844 [Tanacetum coccineum]
MVDWLNIVKTDKVIHTVETDIVKLVVEIESFGMSSDAFDKETGSSDEFEITKLCLPFYLEKDEDEEELMVDWLSIIETDKVIHTVETDIVKLVVEIESFGMSSYEFDKETGSSDGIEITKLCLLFYLGKDEDEGFTLQIFLRTLLQLLEND